MKIKEKEECCQLAIYWNTFQLVNKNLINSSLHKIETKFKLINGFNAIHYLFNNLRRSIQRLPINFIIL